MTRTVPVVTIAILTSALLTAGCTPTGELTGLLGRGAPTGVAGEIAAKAQTVGQAIGGANGFGGMRMSGYMGHMDEHMGFHSADELAQAGGHMSIELTNMAGQACTFHVVFISSPDGVDQQSRDVTVPAGQTVTIDIPCSELVGMGSLTDVGQMACHLADGTQYDNRFCVPGFLNSDFDCGGTFRCALIQDTDDLDQDGDTQEFIVVTSAMQTHMEPNGMMPHGGAGMFGAGMMNGLFSGSGMPGSMMGGAGRP